MQGRCVCSGRGKDEHSVEQRVRVSVQWKDVHVYLCNGRGMECVSAHRREHVSVPM